MIRTIADARPSGNAAAARRWWCGWAAVLMSTAIASFWAFWGAAETFHEGWYYRGIWRNAGLAVVQYFLPAYAAIGAGLLALWRPAAGVLVHLATAAGAFWLFRRMPAGMNLVVWPLLALAAAYAYGRPEPRAWGRRLIVAAPLLTALFTGAYPAWRVLTRPDAVDLSIRRIAGNGVDLVWAPAGPGWDTSGFDWFEGQQRCAHLSADGMALTATAQHVWRLPTVDEAVRSMAYRRRNAGGHWDPVTGRASFRAMPDKESPLWNPYSQVIYWWAADDVGADAYRVAFNGHVSLHPKTTSRSNFAARCVKAPRGA